MAQNPVQSAVQDLSDGFQMFNWNGTGVSNRGPRIWSSQEAKVMGHGFGTIYLMPYDQWNIRHWLHLRQH